MKGIEPLAIVIEAWLGRCGDDHAGDVLGVGGERPRGHVSLRQGRNVVFARVLETCMVHTRNTCVGSAHVVGLTRRNVILELKRFLCCLYIVSGRIGFVRFCFERLVGWMLLFLWRT